MVEKIKELQALLGYCVEDIEEDGINYDTLFMVESRLREVSRECNNLVDKVMSMYDEVEEN